MWNLAMSQEDHEENQSSDPTAGSTPLDRLQHDEICPGIRQTPREQTLQWFDDAKEMAESIKSLLQRARENPQE